jgi:hypothetical protein
LGISKESDNGYYVNLALATALKGRRQTEMRAALSQSPVSVDLAHRIDRQSGNT